jgi:hypothetical protein
MKDQTLNGIPEATAKDQSQWREYCCQLADKIERLQQEISMLREQRRMLLDTFVPERHKRYDIDDESFFAEAQDEPTIEQIIADDVKSLGK